jgi:hypothetical protein
VASACYKIIGQSESALENHINPFSINCLRAKQVQKRAKTSTNKAGTCFEISQMIPKREARAKPQCPLKSTNGAVRKRD